MDALLLSFAKVLEGLGVTGLLIGGLFGLCYYFLTQWQAAQEARITEGKEAVKAIEATKDSLDRLVDVLKAGKA
jgi:uncharacterized membrane protein